MLHWLAGQRPPVSPSVDRDEDGPETPAPVFAVRAFKHALFGTPATAQTKVRRNSAVERESSRPATARPIRPGLTRPRSASDAATLGLDLPPSPTKGILLTPGTAGGRGKSVKFGGLNAESSLNDYFQPDAVSMARNGRAELVRSPSSSNDLQSSAARKDASEISAHCGSQQQCTASDPIGEPKCASGQHWKAEHDIYRESSTNEIRKLITKQRAAKSYAREKEEQCSALTEELHHERSRTELLEKETATLKSQLEAMRAEMAALTVQSKSQVNNVPTSQSLTRDIATRAAGAAAAKLSESTTNEDDSVSALERRSIAQEIRLRHAERRTYEQASRLPAKGITALQALQINAVSGTPQPTQYQPTVESEVSTSDLPHRVSSTRRRHLLISQEEQLPVKQPPLHQVCPEAKENQPDVMASSDEGRTFFSRDGGAIPPDRVAAARARLAARRQARVAH